MEEAQCLIKLNQQQQHVVLKNTFPQGHNLQGGSSNSNPQGGTSSVPSSDGYQGVVNMLINLKLMDVYFSTRSYNYDNPYSTKKGKKDLEDQAPLHIKKPEKERTPHIPKGVYKWTTHNPNARVVPNYLIFKDLAHMPCEMDQYSHYFQAEDEPSNHFMSRT
jgi:hypothetical protein